jgi:hypothetical protein
MSLKHDIEEYPEMWSKEIVAVVEDLKNGKRNAKRKLRKFVNREISPYYYNELIERYKKPKKEKKQRVLYLFGYSLGEWMPVLLFFSVVGAVGIIGEAIGEYNIWAIISAVYLLTAFLLYHHSSTEEKQQKEREIAELKHEIYNLKDTIKGNKFIIELLEKELDKINK